MTDGGEAEMAAIRRRLSDELGDADVAGELAECLSEDALSWRVEGDVALRFDWVLAFTFGNRMLDNGNRLPGPVNDAIADVAVSLALRDGARICAQWEVAEAIGDRIAASRLTAIHPPRDARAEPVYLSTSGAVRQLLQSTGDAASFGVVGVVGFRDHMRRCVTTARTFGLDAHAPADIAMPCDYDPLSGQPWCRSRLAYLLHDIAIRIGERRDMVIAAASADR